MKYILTGYTRNRRKGLGRVEHIVEVGNIDLLIKITIEVTF